MENTEGAMNSLGQLTPITADLFTSLNLKNGDVVFVDRSAVDLDSLAQLPAAPSDCQDVLFIAVEVPEGKTVKDVVFEGLTERQAALEQLWAAIKNKEGWRVGYNSEFTTAVQKLREMEERR